MFPNMMKRVGPDFMLSLTVIGTEKDSVVLLSPGWTNNILLILCLQDEEILRKPFLIILTCYVLFHSSYLFIFLQRRCRRQGE